MVAEIHCRGVPAGDGDLSGISSRIDKDDDVPVDIRPCTHTEPHRAERQLPPSGATDDIVQPIAKLWRVLATALRFWTVNTACALHTAHDRRSLYARVSCQKLKVLVMIVDAMTNHRAVVLARLVKVTAAGSSAVLEWPRHLRAYGQGARPAPLAQCNLHMPQ